MNNNHNDKIDNKLVLRRRIIATRTIAIIRKAAIIIHSSTPTRRLTI